MIESTALRQYVVTHFLLHPAKPLCRLVNSIARKIKKKFFKGEMVFVKSKELAGRIVDSTEKGYLVEIYDDNQSQPQREEVAPDEILRKDSATKNEVLRFLLSVTRDTPLGRMIISPNVQDLCIFKGQKSVPGEPRIILSRDEEEVKQEPRQKSPHSPEKSTGRVEAARREAQRDKILQLPRKEWGIRGAMPEINRRALAVYSFVSIFGEYLKLEPLTLSQFVSSLSSESYNDKTVVLIHSKLLKAIAHERRKSGKEGLGDLIEMASEAVYRNRSVQSLVQMVAGPEYGREKSLPPFTRIQWFMGDASAKTWLAYVRSFLYDVGHLYELDIPTREFRASSSPPKSPGAETPTPNITGNANSNAGEEREKEKANEQLQSPELASMPAVADRLLVLSFLIEVCVIGIRFRTYFDSLLDTLKEKERERSAALMELRRLRGELIIDPESERLKEETKQAEENLLEIEKEYVPEIYRAEISTYVDVKFFLIEEQLLYEHDRKFYFLPREAQPQLFAMLETGKKYDIKHRDALIRYLKHGWK